MLLFSGIKLQVIYVLSFCGITGSPVWLKSMSSHLNATWKDNQERFIYVSFQGLPPQYLFTHHDEPRSRYLVSEYEDKYNRHGYNPVLPPLRTWNGRRLSWIPQKSDFPIIGRFGH